MLDEEKLLRKKGRIRKAEKRKLAKGSATLSGQILRVKTSKTYSGKKRRGLKVII